MTSRQAKQEYRRAGGEPRISEAVRRQIARAAELEERAQKIRDAEVRKKDRRDKKLRKERREEEARQRMGLRDPRIPRPSASQPSLSQWCRGGMQDTRTQLCPMESSSTVKDDAMDQDKDPDVDNLKGLDGNPPRSDDPVDTSLGHGNTYSLEPDELSDGSLSSATIQAPSLESLPSPRELFKQYGWNNPPPSQSPSTLIEGAGGSSDDDPIRLPTRELETPNTSYQLEDVSAVIRNGSQHQVHFGSQLDFDDGKWADYSDSFVSNTQIDRELKCASSGTVDTVETFGGGHPAPNLTNTAQPHTGMIPFESGSQVVAAISNHDGLWSSSSV